MAKKTKRDAVYDFVFSKAYEALAIHSAEMCNRSNADILRIHADEFARAVSRHIVRQYSLLELADIFEWKTRRVRR